MLVTVDLEPCKFCYVDIPSMICFYSLFLVKVEGFIWSRDQLEAFFQRLHMLGVPNVPVDPRGPGPSVPGSPYILGTEDKYVCHITAGHGSIEQLHYH